MSKFERALRGLGACGWIGIAVEVSATVPEGLTAMLGALGCGYVALLLAIGAITGVSPVRGD